MIRRELEAETPDRLYTITGGRSRSTHDGLDLVTLLVTTAEPTLHMPSEQATILRLCQSPTALVELAAELRLPITVIKILVSDLIEADRLLARHPSSRLRMSAGRNDAPHPDAALLEKVLVGLEAL